MKLPFVEIPTGSIQMRDDRVEKEWIVELESFLLSPYPVTQKLYSEVTGSNPSTFQNENAPVETVSWIEAVRFCNDLSNQNDLESCYTIENESVVFDPTKNGYRLPTEAEWEYACKAGSNTPRYGELKDIAWYKSNSSGSTHSVGEKAPNNWGLYDMLGNVWEWCSDIYDETVYGSYRVFRGGGWNDEERGCLATNRRRSHPVAFKIDDLGFRIAKNK